MTPDEYELLHRVYDSTGRARHYKLVGQTPVPCSLYEWMVQFEEGATRRVRLTRIGPFEVSTVFLGLDHRFTGTGAPILFETMTFLRTPDIHESDYEGNNPADGRTCTWLEAEERHAKAVEYLRVNFCHEGEQPEEITDAV